MLVALGSSLPLFVICGALAGWGALLLAPAPLCVPGVRLAQWSYSKTGRTVSERTPPTHARNRSRCCLLTPPA